MADSDLLALGNATCADFEEGASVDATVDYVLQYGRTTGTVSTTRTWASSWVPPLSTLCPSYGSEVQAWSETDD